MTQAKGAWQTEPQCIWVQAGVLTYRPCDRHFECETCPLFQALRGGPASADAQEPGPAAGGLRGEAGDQVAAYLARLLAGCTLHLDRGYSPGHWWVDMSRPPDLTLGIEDHILRMLQPIDDVVVPRAGVWLRRAEPCGWILRGRTALPLRAPLSAEVEEVNARYLDMLRAWGTAPMGDEWLMRVAPHEDAHTVPGLRRGDEALAWHLKSIELIRGALHEAVQGHEVGAVGLTMADGGEPNLDLEVVLGRARFDALVDAAFRTRAS